jgi:uncharacterized protein with HEPN domain
MNERLPPHLDSMRRAASDAIAFVNGMSLEEFTGDKKTQAAAAMCLAIVGESANKLAAEAPEFVAAHPDWAWDQIRGLRNRIVHSYDTLDLPIIWSTVNDFLPLLLTAVAEATPSA